MLARAPRDRLAYRFHARDLNLIMAPSRPGASVRFRVTVNGRSTGDLRGSDVDGDGLGTLDAPRLYQLVRQRSPIEERLFEIEFFGPGAEVFAFSFG